MFVARARLAPVSWVWVTWKLCPAVHRWVAIGPLSTGIPPFHTADDTATREARESEARDSGASMRWRMLSRVRARSGREKGAIPFASPLLPDRDLGIDAGDEILHDLAQLLVGRHQRLDLAARVEHRRVIAPAEFHPDVREGKIGD